MMMGSLAQTAARSQPGMAAMFQPGGSLAGTYSSLFPGQMAPQYQAPKTVDPYGPLYQQAAQRMGLPVPTNPTPPSSTPSSGIAQQWKPMLMDIAKNTGTTGGSISQSPKAYVPGAGAMSPVPTGTPPTPSAAPQQSGSGKSGNAFGHQVQPMLANIAKHTGTNGGSIPSAATPSIGIPGTGEMGASMPTAIPPTSGTTPQISAPKITAPQTSAINPLSISPQMAQMAGNVGQQQITQQTGAGIQDMMRQMGARGLGRSGMALQGAADVINRTGQQQAGQLGQNLALNQMGLNFQGAQQGQQLEAARQQAMAQMGLQSQLGQGQLGLGQQAQNLASIMQPQQLQMQQALGLGQLGLGEEQSQMAQNAQQMAAQNFLSPLLGNLGGSLIGASAQQGGKKG